MMNRANQPLNQVKIWCLQLEADCSSDMASVVVLIWGREQDVVVLPDTTLEITRKRAEELRQAVKELQVYYLDKPLGKITLSFGVAAFPEHGQTDEEILKSAGTALYRAKKEGRDRVVVA